MRLKAGEKLGSVDYNNILEHRLNPAPKPHEGLMREIGRLHAQGTPEEVLMQTRLEADLYVKYIT